MVGGHVPLYYVGIKYINYVADMETPLTMPKTAFAYKEQRFSHFEWMAWILEFQDVAQYRESSMLFQKSAY